ncbi:EAL domain-containing protein [Paenibacillus campi]|uniref:bifunctional diguanylate cyclase/phosphodiesterase n=1 Tax=Paenibacillus campi TaxID=3106031 RepID=UPI002AFE3210|nr:MULTISPECIES: EAL domain-containing protein [unclassified Paenibacillus]
MEHLTLYYNEWIIGLSVLISIVAAYIALNLASKVSQSRGKSKIIWLCLSSFVMGSGVWSMHFVGMLAFHLDMPVHYDIVLTLLSALAAIVASFIAFAVVVKPNQKLGQNLIAGLMMGLGISVMHYTGMQAMQMNAMIVYNIPYVLLSIGIALLASYSALFLFNRFRDQPDFSIWKLISAIVMGFAISGMHYTGMAATHFHHMPGSLLSTNFSFSASQVLLITAVSLVSLSILAVSWAAVFMERHLLERMAYSDPLTALPNRYGLQRYFEKVFHDNMRGAVLFLDLDRFKSINDTLGHDMGDELLIEVARRLRECMQTEHLSGNNQVFRLGGDEFLIAASDISPAQAISLAERMLQLIKQPYHLSGNQIFVTGGSIGIALAPEHGYDRTSLMRAADTAMYVSKNAGKNRYSIFNEEMNVRQLRRMGLENDLRQALELDQLFIVYQPKWDSQHDRLVGMEALLRWIHPELGFVSPAEFIPIAEETGLIIPITYWMIGEVCQQNRDWQNKLAINVSISVNLSARMFENPQFAARVECIVKQSNLSPEYLELEITESIAMNSMEGTVEQLKHIQSLGMRVSLDDFGTGYSSLGRLDEMPVDIIKMDQIFVRKSDQISKQAIVSTIIAIARNLELELVAEGVETAEQIAFLQSRGCYLMQGYYYGKPMTVEQMNNWLKEKVLQMPLAE